MSSGAARAATEVVTGVPALSPTIVDNLVAATTEVFETMVFRNLERGSSIEGDALRPGSNVVGTIAFAGSASGLVTFYSTLETAREIAGAMLGVEPSAVDGEIADAIGEITNMVTGSFRFRMAKEGEVWATSAPTVRMGSDRHFKPMTSGHRVLLPFTMDDHEVFVELIVMKS
jgi:chemotaxis protein CheX